MWNEMFSYNSSDSDSSIHDRVQANVRFRLVNIYLCICWCMNQFAIYIFTVEWNMSDKKVQASARAGKIEWECMQLHLICVCVVCLSLIIIIVIINMLFFLSLMFHSFISLSCFHSCLVRSFVRIFRIVFVKKKFNSLFVGHIPRLEMLLGQWPKGKFNREFSRCSHTHIPPFHVFTRERDFISLSFCLSLVLSFYSIQYSVDLLY